MDVLFIVTIFIAILLVLYIFQIWRIQNAEPYVNFINEKEGQNISLDNFVPQVAGFTQELPLADFLTAKPKFTTIRCADKERQTELGGQYIQRTNNYKHDYPDNCSQPLADMEIYEVDGTIPCEGLR